MTGGSTAAEGTVNVQYQEYQGTICDDEFDDIEATVICHMLGYRLMFTLVFDYLLCCSQEQFVPPPVRGRVVKASRFETTRPSPLGFWFESHER